MPDGYIELRSDRVGALMLRFLSASLLTAMVFAGAPAFANEFCDKEMAPLVQQRTALTAKLNDIGKHAKQAGAREKFCGTLTTYIGNITKFVNYMEQNKDFCGIPQEAIDSARKGLGQNQTLRKRVCSGPPPEARPGNGKPAVPQPPVELRLQ
ncbi:hypothetical protein [Labrys wisconsinensis]|nr:hypothetical protein [Labrys wisconsinensis]